jgi:hypothetical protein
MKHKIFYDADKELYGMYCPKDCSYYRWSIKPNYCPMCGKNLKSIEVIKE